jgi:hypothetical protein
MFHKGALDGAYKDRESYLLIPLTGPPLTVLEPTTVGVAIEDQAGRHELGSFVCEFMSTPPIDVAERDAIRSRVGATKTVMMTMTCNRCKAQTDFFLHLDQADRTPPPALPSGTHIYDMPDQWKCDCGMNNLTLMYIKKGWHESFRAGYIKSAGFQCHRLYERSQLVAIHDEFHNLISGTPREEDVQKFMERHPVVWSFLTPLKILAKPPLLTKNNADFAILTAQKILYLVEIEKPQTIVATKKGDVHSEVSKAFSQVRDWALEIANHRVACLDCMGLRADEVHDVRYIVIAGLATRTNPTALTKLQQNIPTGKTSFYCFDEIAALLHALQSHFDLL